MKVAIHAGQLLQPVPGGIGRYVGALLAHLPAAGIRPVAFAAGPRPPGVPAAAPWIDLGPPRGSLRYESWHRLRRPVVRVDADAVHAPSLAVPPAGRTPLVVTVHDVAFLRFPGATTRRGQRFHRRGLELARREADLVLSPSHFTRGELVAEGFDPERIVVTPIGVTFPHERDPAEVDAAVARTGVRPPYVLTVGTVEPRKDLPTLVTAVERLRARHPELSLVIVGPKGWGDVRGLERPGVHLTGELPWRVVDALYRRARVCCIASRYEGFGIPALEAMARGAPLVAADGSAIAEVVADAGARFPPGDVEALTSTLERLVTDDAHRDELVRRGRARAGDFTLEASARRHADAYRLAVQRHAER